MFNLSATFNEVATYTAFTGLSLGAIAGLAALAFYFSFARGPAIALAIMIAGTYGGFLYGEHNGRANVQARWDAADAKAATDAKTRDDAAAKSAQAKYAPVITGLQKQFGDAQQKIATDEKTLLAAKSSAACPLGSSALRLRANAQ